MCSGLQTSIDTSINGTDAVPKVGYPKGSGGALSNILDTISCVITTLFITIF